MKKILLLSVVMLFSIASYAQFSLGAKVGYNTSLGFSDKWHFDASSMNIKNDLANGFHVGVFARIGRSFYVQPELLYNLSIYDKTLDIVVADMPVKKIKTSTFDIPVLAGWSILNTNMFKFRIMAGPKFSFNIGSTKLDSWTNAVATAKSARVGLDTGLGIDIWRISLDVRYNLMSDLYNIKDVVSNEKLNTKPINSFAISIGYSIFGNNNKK